MSSPSKYVHVSFEFNSPELTEDEMWPDGDMPERPTADDVVEIVNESGGLRSVINDWSLIYGGRVTVVVTDKDNVSTTTSAIIQ